MVDDGDVGGIPCILTTTDLDSVAHGSRKPMQDFHSPFLNKTEDEIRAWMLEHVHNHPNFARTTFTILDENTVKNKICRMGYISEVTPDDRMLCTDFYADMYVRVPIEMGTLSWDEEELVGTREVYNQEIIEKEHSKAQHRKMAK